MAAIERGGVASFYVGGAYLSVKASISVKMGGLARAPVVDSAGNTVGFSTKGEPPEVTLTAIDGPAVSLAALKAINGPTVQIGLNNGKKYQLINAFATDDPEAKIDAGEIDGIKLSGTRCQEITG